MSIFYVLLGADVPSCRPGEVSLFDWAISERGKPIHKLSRPPSSHILVGVPDTDLSTCRKVETERGTLYRGGGFACPCGMLLQIYSDSVNIFVVAELLESQSQMRIQNTFLDEAGIQVWKRSGRLVVIRDNLEHLVPLTLLHACLYEQ